MNNKEVPDINRDQSSTPSDWKYCPICGNQLPNIQNLKFCIVCGTDIQYIKDYKELRSVSTSNPYKTSSPYSRYETPTVFYGPELIDDEKLLDTKDHKLWGTTTSIGLPIAALFTMNFLAAGFLILIIPFSNDFTILPDLVSNSYLISAISLFELIFIAFPLFYVGQYLRNPTLKNRLILLGFTTRNYDRKRILKEILLGLGFALIGVVVVTISSIAIELIVEFFFNVDIIHDTTGLTGEIIPTDLLSFIVFSIVIILVIGTSEEILFRGFMQKGLVRNLGEKWGIIITAFIFSLIHLIGIFFIALESPYLFIISFILSFTPYFAISLMIGWIYHWRNENLLAVMVTHGVYDVLTILMAYFLYGMLL